MTDIQPAVGAPTTPVGPTVDEQVAKFIELRDVIKELDDLHEKKLKPLKEAKEAIGGWLMQFLEANGVDSAKTKLGTVHTTTRSSTSLQDAQAFMDFVINHEYWELLDRRANATAVKDYVKEHNGNLPPGVNLSSIKTVGVRRA